MKFKEKNLNTIEKSIWIAGYLEIEVLKFASNFLKLDRPEVILLEL